MWTLTDTLVILGSVLLHAGLFYATLISRLLVSAYELWLAMLLIASVPLLPVDLDSGTASHLRASRFCLLAASAFPVSPGSGTLQLALLLPLFACTDLFSSLLPSLRYVFHKQS